MAILIQPLAWKPPYATSVALKRQKKKKKKERNRTSFFFFLIFLLAFKIIFVRSLADCVDNRRETSVAIHGTEYSLCQNSLEKNQ